MRVTIAGATSDTYTPKAGDVGGMLTATASYFDGQKPPDDTTKKTAMKVADKVVAAGHPEQGSGV